MHMIPEKDILSACMGWLQINGWLAWRMPIMPVLRGQKGDLRFSKSPIGGFPDIAGLIKPPNANVVPMPYFFAVELKTEKGRLSCNQVHWISLLKEKAVPVIVARSCDEMISFLHLIQDKFYLTKESK